jgi:hypothetical protein
MHEIVFCCAEGAKAKKGSTKVCVLDWVGDRNAGEAKREKKLLAALLCNWKELCV